MRRTLSYLSVALLAFGIGSFAVINIYTSNQTNIKSEKVQYETPIHIQANIKEDSKFVCKNEIIKAVWINLAVVNDFYESANAYIKEHKTKDCLEIFDSIKDVDLNNDGVNETVIQSNSTMFCGSAGDCGTWIVSKISGKYQVIFDSASAESLEGLQPLKTKTNKFKNLKIRLNNGIQEDNIGIFVFDGKEYKLKKCFVDINSGGNYYDKKLKKKLLPVKLDSCG